ncbi:DUF3558 family protein [Rhodococcoides yunnanense]|uniref:DUF3558 family protein n=1 Tax=Rhodococcoides yunnanense TaxID=278209 RepID=UPI001FEB6A3A|nr:DUF3558 family protein [Rhodococcus yunnanensis]
MEPHAVGEPTRWDPCSITPEAIGATGLDPGYRDEGWGDGIVVPDWAICSFRISGVDIPYVLVVKSSLTHTVGEARADTRNIDGRDIALGDHGAFEYKLHVGKTGRSCEIAVDVPPGIVVFSVIDMDRLTDDRLCGLVEQHAHDLQDSLPNAMK